MKKIIGWALDLLFGPAGEDYVSRTSIEQARLESMSLEELQREMNTIRAERRSAVIRTERSSAVAMLDELDGFLAAGPPMCRFCGPVCICGGRRRS